MAASSRPCRGIWSVRLAPDQHDRVAGAGGHQPAVGQRLGVLVADQPGLGGGRDRRQGARGAQVRHLVGVLQLQQLNGPLDVGQPAAAELGVRGPVGGPRQPFGVHPRLDPADLDHVPHGQPALRVAELGGRGEERGAQLAVAGNRTGPQQRLPFPGDAVPGPVRPVSGQWPDQWAVLALGPQVGVDLQRRVGVGRPSSRDIRSATACASARASDSSSPGSGSMTNTTSASEE